MVLLSLSFSLFLPPSLSLSLRFCLYVSFCLFASRRINSIAHCISELIDLGAMDSLLHGLADWKDSPQEGYAQRLAAAAELCRLMLPTQLAEGDPLSGR